MTKIDVDIGFKEKCHMFAENCLNTYYVCCIDKYRRGPGANPTTLSYNASPVKIYNATSSLVRFENKNIVFYFEKQL
jgi:hypothetical protein